MNPAPATPSPALGTGVEPGPRAGVFRGPLATAGLMLTPFLFLVPACRAPGPIDKDLPRAIPAEAQAFVQTHDTEQDRALRRVYADAWKELRRSKVFEEFSKALARSAGEDPEEWVTATKKLLETAESLPFEECSAGGGAFGFSFHPRLPEEGQGLEDFDFGLDLVGVNRVDPATATALGDRLAAAIRSLDEMIPPLHAIDESTADIRTLSLSADEVPLGMHMALWDRYLLLSLTREDLRRAIDGLQGRSGHETILDRAAFRDAMSTLPPPTAELSLLAIDDLIASYLELLDQLVAREDGEDAGEVLATVHAFVDEFRLFDTLAVSAGWEEDLRREEEILDLRRDGSPRVLEDVLFQGRSLSGWKEWIPSDATSFAVWAGPEPGRLYEALLDMIERHAGTEVVQKWSEIQQESDFVVRRDLPLAELTGNLAVMSFPAISSSPFGGGGEWAVLLETWDQEQTWAKVEALLDDLETLIAEETGGDAASVIRFEDVPVSGGGMRAIKIVPFPFVSPVIGVSEGHVILASSSKTASKVLGRLRGEGETIEASEKLAGLGLSMPDTVYAASFSDLEGSMHELADALQAVGMATAFMPPGSTDESVRQILRLIPRLAPAVRKLDVRLARASVTRLESGRLRSTTVTRYALPSGENAGATDVAVAP